jgi:hypothetical protein
VGKARAAVTVRARAAVRVAAVAVKAMEVALKMEVEMLRMGYRSCIKNRLVDSAREGESREATLGAAASAMKRGALRMEVEMLRMGYRSCIKNRLVDSAREGESREATLGAAASAMKRGEEPLRRSCMCMRRRYNLADAAECRRHTHQGKCVAGWIRRRRTWLL